MSDQADNKPTDNKPTDNKPDETAFEDFDAKASRELLDACDLAWRRHFKALRTRTPTVAITPAMMKAGSKATELWNDARGYDQARLVEAVYRAMQAAANPESEKIEPVDAGNSAEPSGEMSPDSKPETPRPAIDAVLSSKAGA